MNFEELVEKKGLFVSLEHITVPRRILGEGKLSIVVNVSNDFGALHFSQENKHLITTLQINFPHNVMFSVMGEFTEDDSSERFHGDRFRIYTKSRQLEFVGNMAPFSKEVFPGKKLLHYSIICFEDTVDVFSYVEPTIREV